MPLGTDDRPRPFTPWIPALLQSKVRVFCTFQLEANLNGKEGNISKWEVFNSNANLNPFQSRHTQWGYVFWGEAYLQGLNAFKKRCNLRKSKVIYLRSFTLSWREKRASCKKETANMLFPFNPFIRQKVCFSSFFMPTIDLNGQLPVCNGKKSPPGFINAWTSIFYALPLFS